MNSKKLQSLAMLSLVFGALNMGTAHAGLEKYSATVEDGTPKVLHHTTNTDGDEPEDALAEQDTGIIPEPEPAPAVVAPAEKRVSERKTIERTVRVEQAREASKFDIVPDQRVAEVAQRLKYTNEILKRFGRAYDYRITTTTELKKALTELELADESKKKALN